MPIHVLSVVNPWLALVNISHFQGEGTNTKSEEAWEIQVSDCITPGDGQRTDGNVAVTVVQVKDHVV